MKTAKKLLASLLAAILLMPTGIIVPAQAAEAMTATVTNVQTLSHGEEMCGVFTLENGKYHGLCAHVGIPNPEAGDTVTMVPASPALRALAYEASKQDLFNWTDKTVWNLHEAASEIYSKKHNGTLMSQARDFIDRANAASEGKALDGSDIPDNFGAWISNGAGGVQELLVWGLKPTGTLTLKKSSANPAISDGNSSYTLAGAEYAVKNRSGVYMGTLKTTANGNANDLILDAGPYTVTETVAPNGYALDPTVYTVTVKSGETETLYVSDQPLTGQLTLKKSSANPTISDGNSSYTLAGAEYAVKNSSGVYMGTLKTDANGNANTLTLPLATYTVTETVAPKGYALDPTVYTVTVRAGQIETVRVSDVPQSDPVGVLLRKIDKTSGDGETC